MRQLVTNGFSLLLVLIVIAVVASLPEIQRYLRIRNM
jgi:CHASE3 domain sensor protein